MHATNATPNAANDERRDRWNRQPELLEQHVRENQRESVFGDQVIHAFALRRP
jgi:hypothetical protein